MLNEFKCFFSFTPSYRGKLTSLPVYRDCIFFNNQVIAEFMIRGMQRAVAKSAKVER